MVKLNYQIKQYCQGNYRYFWKTLKLSKEFETEEEAILFVKELKASDEPHFKFYKYDIKEE